MRSALTEKEVEDEYRDKYQFLTKKFLQNRRYLRRGGPKWLKVGSKVFYRRADIEAWIESCVIDNTAVR